jgi:hypothetical protein
VGFASGGIMRAEIRMLKVLVYEGPAGEIGSGKTMEVIDILDGTDIDYHRNF